MLYKVIQRLLFVSVLALYIVGNNQIVDADTAASMVSQSSIVFDKTYIPQLDESVKPIIPDGSNKIVKYSENGMLPKTGEESSIGWQRLGISLMIISLSIKIKKILGECLK